MKLNLKKYEVDMANSNTSQAKKSSSSTNENWQNWNGWANWQNWQQSWPNMGRFPDFNKNAARMFDYNRLRQTSGRNAETVTTANQVALEGMQAIARRIAEVLQENAKQGMECFRDASSCKTAEEAQWRQNDLISCLVQNCCGNAREITEITAKAAVEIVDIWNKRAAEALSEWNDTASK